MLLLIKTLIGLVHIPIHKLTETSPNRVKACRSGAKPFPTYYLNDSENTWPSLGNDHLEWIYIFPVF